MGECGGSHPTYRCDRHVFWTNKSGHSFCREHAVMHEAQLAGGFAQRIAEAGDAYLVSAVVEAVANLAAFVDRWPDHDRGGQAAPPTTCPTCGSDARRWALGSTRWGSTLMEPHHCPDSWHGGRR